MAERLVVETKGVPASLQGKERISSKSLKVGFSSEESSGEAQWVRQQKKAFQRWCNAFLIQRSLSITNLEEDIASGVLLCNLLELLAGKKLPAFNKAPKMKVQKVLNSQIALDFITKTEKLKLVGIGPEDIFDGKTKLILGLIWTLILKFQIQAGKWTVAGKKTTAKSELLEWCNSALAADNIQVTDFQASWKDGIAFEALLNYLLRQRGREPVSLSSAQADPVVVLDQEFELAEAEFQIPKLLDANDMSDPDELSVMTYVSYFRQKDKLSPEEIMKRTQQPAGSSSSAKPTPAPTTTTAKPAPSALSKSAASLPAAKRIKSIHAEGKGLTHAICGEEASFALLTKDENEEVFYQADSVFYGTLVLGPIEVPASINDSKNGVFKGTYTLQTAGTYDLTILHNKKPISETQFHVVAEPGKAYGPTSYADGKGIIEITPGEDNIFKVFTFDRFSNPISKGGNKVDVKIEGPEANIKSVVTDDQNGAYQISYSVTKGGKFKIFVILNGEPIQGSPFEVTVSAGDVNAQYVIVEGEGLSKVVAGEIAKFLVHARDQFGNVSYRHGEARSVGARLVGPSELDCAVEDLLNGSYAVTYEPTVSGKHKLYVQWNEEDTKGSPFDVTVLPGPLSAAKSPADGEGLTKAVVGVEASFVIVARDAYRNKLTTGGAHIVVVLQLEGHNEEIHGHVKDNNDGTYVVTYVVKIIGTYKLSVSIGNTKLLGSPFHVIAHAGPVDPSNTVVEGAALSGVPAGEVLYLTIRPRDKFGNPSGEYALGDIQAFLEGPEKLVASIKPTHGETTLTLSAKPVRAGDYALHVTYKGENIKGTPHKISAVAAKASAIHTTAEGPGLQGAVAGEKTKFTVIAKDESGARVTFGGGIIGGYLEVEGPEKEYINDDNVEDNKNGTYTVHYTPKTAGFTQLHVTYDGYAIHNSPFGFVVAPGGPHGKESTAFGDGLTDATAGIEAEFSVAVRDKNSNLVNPDEHIKVTAELSGPAKLKARITDNKDATYLAQYTPEIAGEYKLDVEVNGDNVKDSPFKLKVAPGKLSPAHSVAEGRGLEEAVAGEVAKFVILPKDAFGNTIAERVDVSAQFDGLPADILRIVKAPQDGYKVDYNLTRAGRQKLTVSVAGVPVKGSPFSVDVHPAAVDADYFVFEGKTNVVSGEKASFVVRARDKFGNESTTGGAKVEANLLKLALKDKQKDIKKRGDGLLVLAHSAIDSVGERIGVKVADRHNGTYTGEYTLSSAGEYALNITVNGVPLKLAPFVIIVESAEVDVHHTIVRGKAISGPVLAGDEIKVEIIPKDKLGNTAVIRDTDKFEAKVKAPTSTDPVAWKVTQTPEGPVYVEGLAKIPGKYLAEFFIANKPVNGSPFVIVVEAGKISHVTSYVDTAGLSPGVAGKPLRAVLHALDDRGTVIPSGGATVVAQLLGPEETPAAVSDNKDGTYNITFAPKLAGSYSLLLKAEGQPIKGTPFIVHIEPGDLEPANSLAFGPGLIESPAGQEAEFTVQTKDTYGNNLKTGGHQVNAALEGPEAVNSQITDKLDGTYHAKYTPRLSGIYNLAVTVNNHPVKDSPFKVEVTPGTADASHTTAEGKGLSQATANETAFFTVIARDALGNKVLVGGTKVAAVLKNTANGHTEPIALVDNHDGTYTADYTVGVLGNYVIEVHLDGVAIKDSPFRLSADAGAASTSNTVADGDGLSNAVSGQEAEFVVITKDSNGNLIGKGGHHIKARLKGPEKIVGTVHDKNDGTYHVKYTATIAGNYSLRVKVDKHHISGSPFKVAIAPGKVSAAKSVATGDSLSKATAGISERIIIHAKDAAGNNLKTGGDHFVVVSESLDDGEKTKLYPVDHKDGTYSVEYTPYATGLHALHITHKGVHIKDSPFSVSVSPGAPSAFHTVASGEGLTKAVAGEPAHFIVTLKDAYGNVLTSSAGVTIVAKVEESTDVETYNNKDGTFRVQYRVTKAGTHNIYVTADDKPIADSPFQVEVYPGAPSPAHTWADGEGLTSAKAGHAGRFIIHLADVYDNPLTKGDIWLSSVLWGPITVRGQVTDLEDGTYSVEYKSDITGSFQLHTTFNSGGEIKDSPHTIIIEAGEPYAPNTAIEGILPLVGEAGKPFQVTIGGRDAFGNKVTKGGLHVYASVALGDTPAEEFPVVDKDDGTYVGEHTVTASGIYLVVAKAGEDTVKGSPYKYEVKSGDASPETSTLEGPDSINSGESTYFVVKLKDEFGNTAHGVADVVGAFVSAKGESIPAAVSAHATGIYHLDFKPVKAGAFKLEAKFNGHAIKGTPKHIVVAPAKASSEHSKVILEDDGDKQGAKAGKPIRFRVQFFDQFGNAIASPTVGLSAVKALFRPISVVASVALGSTSSGPGRQRSSSGGSLLRSGSNRGTWQTTSVGSVTSRSFSNLQAIPEPVVQPLVPFLVEKEDGTIFGEVIPSRVGKYQLEISLDDVLLKEGSFGINVEPGELSAAHSTLEGPAVQGAGANAGEPVQLTLVLRDSSGNKLERLPAHVDVQADLEDTHDQPTKPSVSANADHTYTIAFTGYKVGRYKLNVTVNHTPIEKSPFVIVVDSGVVHPGSSTASGEGLHTSNVGEPTHFKVVLMDKGGNQILKGGSAVTSFLQGPEKVDVAITDNNDGTYSAKYIVNQVGEYKLHVVVDGKPIAASPFEVVSKSGKPHPDGSQLEGKFDFHVGRPQEFIVRLRDKAGNPVKAATGVVISGVVEPVDAEKVEHYDVVKVETHNNGDGTVRVVVPGIKKAGNHELKIDLDGESLKGSPFRVVIPVGEPKKVILAGQELLNENGAISSIAGSTSSFVVFVSDQYGNLLRTRDDNLDLKVEVQGPAKVTLGVDDNDDGSFTIAYKLTMAGIYATLFTWGHSQATVESDIHIQVLPTEFSPSHSIILGNGTKKAKAYEEAKFMIQSTDKYANEVQVSGAEVHAVIKGPENSDDPEEIVVSIIENNGIYNATYIVHQVGKYTLSVTSKGTPIAQSPYHVRVKPGLAVASKSIVKPLSDLPEGRAKSDTPAFRVHLRDKNGNMKTKGGEKELEVYLRKPIRKPARIKDNKDGTYDVIYPKGLEVGEYEVVAELRGEKFDIPNTTVVVEEPGSLPEEEQELLHELLPNSSSTLTNFLRGLDDEKKTAFLGDLRALYKK